MRRRIGKRYLGFGTTSLREGCFPVMANHADGGELFHLLCQRNEFENPSEGLLHEITVQRCDDHDFPKVDHLLNELDDIRELHE